MKEERGFWHAQNKKKREHQHPSFPSTQTQVFVAAPLLMDSEVDAQDQTVMKIGKIMAKFRKKVEFI